MCVLFIMPFNKFKKAGKYSKMFILSNLRKKLKHAIYKTIEIILVDEK